VKTNKVVFLTLIIALFSNCEAFLGPEPSSSPKGIFDAIWNDFNETYALFAHKGIDWDSVYNMYSPQIFLDMTDLELSNVCADMLETLEDAHVWLITPVGTFRSYAPPNDYINLNLNNVKEYYLQNNGTEEENILYGTFIDQPHIGYIHVNTFGGDIINGSSSWAKKIDGIIQSLSATDALVLDIRGNGGGNQANMSYIASRFAGEEKDYMIIKTKNGPGKNDFSTPLTFTVKPAGIRYTKPIVLLTNNGTASAAEQFTLALLTQGHITHAGGTTIGAFSTRMFRYLINGWKYSISIQYVTDSNGYCFEGEGISPKEHTVTNDSLEDVRAGIDKQLEYAVRLLTDK